MSDFLSPPARVAGLLANSNNAATGGSTSDLQAGPAPSRRGSTNATLIRMGEATALPLVLCGLLQHEFGSPFSPMPSRRSSHAPPTASSPLLLEQRMMASLATKQTQDGENYHFSRNGTESNIRAYLSTSASLYEFRALNLRWSSFGVSCGFVRIGEFAARKTKSCRSPGLRFQLRKSQIWRKNHSHFYRAVRNTIQFPNLPSRQCRQC